MTTIVTGPALSVRPLESELLEDKLRIPRPGLAVLPRSRVAGLIDAAVSRRVTLVTGPPGAGKTVALAQWATARPANRRPAWVTLDQADSDPGQFWSYVTAALSRSGAMAAVGAGRPGPPAGMAAADIPQWISAVVRPAADPVLLILDGVHALAGGESLAGLDELIKHEPAGLRLVLAGRSAPGLALSRLRLAGDLADIGAAELACTAEETAAYFGMLGRPLSPADRDQIFRRTEGWLAGLRLTALAEPPDPADHSRLADQAGPAEPGDGVAGDYLQDELLGQLPAEVRNFMLRTCLTSTVSPELARDLTGETGAARLLAQLSKDSGLVQPISAQASEYRYHPMLKDVLAADLRRELPDEVAELHGRVARWYAARGEVLPAVQAAAEVGDWEFGVQLLRDAGPAVLLSPAGPGLEAALAAVPRDRLAAEPELAIARAAGRLWQGDADGAVPHLEAAESVLASRPGPADSQDRAEADLWLAALRVLYQSTVLPPRPGWLDAEWELAARAHAGPRGACEHRALGTLWLALGFAALREFDSQLARSALLHAGSQLSAGGLLLLRERGKSWEALACALYGDLAAATRLAASVSEGPHGRDDDLVPVLALAGAAVSLARDEPDAAAGQLDQADLAAMSPRPAGEPSIAVVSGLLRARLALAEGNLAGARGLVRWLTDASAGAVQAGYSPGLPGSHTDHGRTDHGRTDHGRTDHGGHAGTGRGRTEPGRADLGRAGAGTSRPYGATAVIAALDAEISLAGGERERARATLAALAESGQGPGDAPARPEAIVGQARLLIADSDDKGALALVAPLLADVTGACSMADRIAALLAAVVAHRRLGQASEAAELLSQALAAAEPEDACGPFIAAGSPVRSALTVLISPSSRCAGFAGRILDRFDGRAPRPASTQTAALLTDSELAVLRFLPSHMTNQEIAEALFLSINTIKTHLSSVYRKLGVANRRQAIAQGRRLELL